MDLMMRIKRATMQGVKGMIFIIIMMVMRMMIIMLISRVLIIMLEV